MSPLVAGILGYAFGLVTGVVVSVGIVRRIAAMGRETRLAQERQQSQIAQAEREAAWSGWQDTRTDWN